MVLYGCIRSSYRRGKAVGESLSAPLCAPGISPSEWRKIASEAFMKRRFPFPGLLALLALCLFASPIHAQTSAAAAKPAARAGAYDISKEVTLTGTVTSVLKETTPEMKTLGGGH